MTHQHDTAHQAFDAFVRRERDGLFRAAYLLTGDRHHAEDLVQTALARMVRRWGTVDEPAAYVRRVLYTQFVSWWRRRRSRGVETLVADVPESHAPPPAEPELAMVLAAALDRLTPRQRAVLVLRFYEDRTESDTAVLLGCRVGTVKSQTRHALQRLRQVAPELADFATRRVEVAP
ncbi:SigE family RNA polymerase sigma factor [Solwaraspora sp. WMMD791]|uniref:SigE family RNA polymerase sigma factor n=1 Tax=Solwaraspora sp. WMMD791 TaxID=3016086 RepID=UPI00249C70B2|nr:SigE family RNA polymerase sigma factor [Solwaraspora sp. WMMD791]WFE26629.1 SigE family RNA polymerase sigma factor [Solwaraspora sp. WMMD791]